MNQLPPFPESTFFQVSDDVNSIIYHELLCCIWNIGKERRSIYAHYYNVYTKELLNQISLYFYFFWIFKYVIIWDIHRKDEYTGRNNSVGTHKGFISDTKYVILNFIFFEHSTFKKERFLISRIFTRKKRALNYWSVNKFDRTCDGNCLKILLWFLMSINEKYHLK